MGIKKVAAMSALAVSSVLSIGVVSAGSANAVAVSGCAQGNNLCASVSSDGVFDIGSYPLPGSNGVVTAGERANFQASVKHIQAKVGVTQDGVFGSDTRAAVMRFQKAHHLTTDGVVGASTARAMGLVLNYIA